MYGKTSDEACYDGDGDPALDHYINPRTLLFGIVLVQTILVGLVCCCMPLAIMGMVKAG